jgi:ankyrin repeat protein
MSYFNVSRWLSPATMAALLLMMGCQSTPESAPDVVDEATESVDSIDRKIWFAAADAGDTETLRALLDEGVDPLIEQQGLTALHIAARHGYIDAARLLVDAGVDVNLVPNETEAALASAAGHGNPRIVELIAGGKLDPQAIASVTNLRSPLNLAVENGHAEIASLLIAAGSDVNAHGDWYSPLHSAILYGDITIVKLLLENGSNVNARVRIHDRTKFSGFRYVRPLELARIIERDDVVELVRRYGGRG